MSAEGANLQRIQEAILQHNGNCEYPATEIRMNPFEIDRLGWTDFRGLPIVPDEGIGTGRFELRCDKPDGSAGPVIQRAEEVAA